LNAHDSLSVQLKDVRLKMRMESILWYKCRNTVLAFTADLALARAKLYRDRAKNLAIIVKRAAVPQQPELQLK